MPEKVPRLRALFEEKGLVCPPEVDRETDLFTETLAKANGVPPEQALEWLAAHFGIVPFEMARSACSTRAEQVFRKLARPCETARPWMPFGTIGFVLLCAHFDPSAEDTWGIPDHLIQRVLVGRSAYERLKSDFFGRLDLAPLNPAGPGTSPGINEPPKKGAGLLTALNWTLENYPLSMGEVEKLKGSIPAFEGIDKRRTGDYKLLPRDCAIAFEHMCSGKSVFSADVVSPQDFFPDNLLEKHNAYPMFIGDECVYLLSETRDNYAFEDEWLSSGQDPIKIHYVLADADAIREAISRNRGRSIAAATASVEPTSLVYADDLNLVEIEPAEIQRINPANINTTPEQIIQWVLFRAVTLRASDLHVEKYFNTARLRARIDGELQIIHSCTDELLPRFVSLLKNYANMGQRRQTAEDGRFSMRIGQRRIDCRVSAIPCSKDLQKITIRFLDKKDGIRQLSELNLSKRQTEIIKSTLSRDQGLILVTGPTGSGKTTSLYAFINSINSDTINIHTVEDPIEYEIEGINQTQTDPINDIDFSEGLRRILRADPDVILIGESRDEETASAAVNAALTGHLVLTTLHANDSLRAVSRLISMGVAPYLLADSLALSQAQRLVRRLCPHCKRPGPVSDEVRSIFDRNAVPMAADQNIIYMPSGCPECNGSGYTGRIALMEMCAIGPEISDMIARNASQGEMRAVAQRAGLLSLYQEGLIQVLAGQTTLEEIACLSYTALDSSGTIRLD